MQEPVIELKELSKLFGFGDATTIALNEIDLTVQKGEFVAIMGPSGSGKSTLMNIIGLLDRPSNGQYILAGKPVEKLRQNQRAKVRRDKIGFIFQSFNLLSTLTAIDNVALPLQYKNMVLGKRLKQADSMLQKVGLGEKEYFYPSQLSGGQVQRVAIARALVCSPNIIIADEPTGNLDSVSSRKIMELLSEIHQAGSTILMVTHNPELTRYATRIIYMQDGSVINDESTKLGVVPESARMIESLQPEEDTVPKPKKTKTRTRKKSKSRSRTQKGKKL